MLRFLLLLFTLVGMAGCQPGQRIEPDDLLWPLPPDLPRIKYVKSIYSEDDIGRPLTIRELLLGRPYTINLARPYGIFARNEKIYVTDILALRFLLYDLSAKQAFAMGGDGSLKVPAAVASDSEGTIYVADAAQARINVYNEAGRYITAYGLGGGRPVALALNENLDRLYTVDRNGHRVVVLNRAGSILFEFGVPGRAEGQFNLPLSIALDRLGNVYVLDAGNFRVQIFDRDGRFISMFGSVGDRPGFFSNPKGIAVDSEGHIYVTDAAFSNFQIFDAAGNVLLFVGRLGTEPGSLYLPAGISIDEQDRIYIADQLNSRIQIFQYLKVP